MAKCVPGGFRSFVWKLATPTLLGDEGSFKMKNADLCFSFTIDGFMTIN